MSYTRKAFVGFGTVFVCLVIANILGYLLRLVLARSLTTSEYGLIYAIMALFGFFGMFQTLGLQEALVQRTPKLKTPEQLKTAMLTVMYTQLLSSGLLFLLAIVFSQWLSVHYFRDPAAAPLLILFAVYIFLAPIAVTIVALFRGLGRTQWYGYSNLIQAAALFGLTILFLATGRGIFSVMLAYVFASFTLLVVYLPALLRIMPSYLNVKARYDSVLLKEFFAFSLPLMLSGAAGVFLADIDTFFLTLYRSLAEVGMYNVALPTAGILWFLSGVINAVLFPLASEMSAKNHLATLKDGIRKMYSYLFVAVLPFAIIFLLYADIILNALFGGQYVAAALTLQILVLGGVLFLYHSINAAVLSGLGNTKSLLYSFILAACINVVGDIVLIPPYGMAGSAAATFFAFIVMLTASVIYTRRSIRFTVDIVAILKTLLVGLLFGFVLFLLRNNLALPLWWKACVSIVLSGIIYITLIFALHVVTKEELLDLRNRVTGK